MNLVVNDKEDMRGVGSEVRVARLAQGVSAPLTIGCALRGDEKRRHMMLS